MFSIEQKLQHNSYKLSVYNLNVLLPIHLHSYIHFFLQKLISDKRCGFLSFSL